MELPNMEKTVEQLKPVFEKVADKIGQGAAFGWEVVLRQQIAYGIIALFFALLGMVGIVIGWKLKNKIKWNSYENEGLKIVCVILFLGSLTSLITGSIHAILRLSNPAYYALQFFIQLGAQAVK